MAQPESNAPVPLPPADAPAPLVTTDAARASRTRHNLPPPALPTRLETFLKSRGIKATHLERASGYSRQHLLRICRWSS